MTPAVAEDWERSGLPDECPECGERDDLAAMVHRMRADGVNELPEIRTATVICEACDHEWPWGCRMDDEGDE